MRFTQDWFTHNVPNFEICTKAAPGNDAYLEIGSYEGRSSCWLLQNALADNGELVCIDPYFDLLDVLDTFKDNVTEARKEGQRLTLLQEPAYNAISRLVYSGGAEFDFIYVDGNHAPHMALMDGAMAWGLLKKGGTMLFDDYQYPHEPTKDGIDGFLLGFKGMYEIIVNNYQLGIKKL